MATACRHRGSDATREAPAVIARRDQLAARESQAGPFGVSERPVVPLKPGNAGGGKGPQLKRKRSKRRRTEGLAMSLATPASVQKLQKALHEKAKESPSYRFYACTTRCTGRTFWLTPTNAAKPTAEQREWTVRSSRTSRSTEWSDGWTNWRKS